jgi:hypothetical protein
MESQPDAMREPVRTQSLGADRVKHGRHHPLKLGSVLSLFVTSARSRERSCAGSGGRRTKPLRWRTVRWLPAAVVLAVAQLVPADATNAAAPPFLMVTGPPHVRPILLDDQRENLRILTALVDAPFAPPAIVKGLEERPRLDLGLFWRWTWTNAPTHPADASDHGSLYPGRGPDPAVAVVRLDGTTRPRIVPERALAILRRRGVAVAAPASTCPVSTRMTAVAPNAGSGAAGFNFGSRLLRVHLYLPQGILTAGPLRDGGVYATVAPDGSIHVKLGWWRKSGRLRVSGLRLDRPAPPLRSDVPDGYGDRGFQPTGITFPTTGCWRVTGRSGTVTLSFVVWVATV